MERNRMREYSANIGDALSYKIRVFAIARAKQERERAKQFQSSVARQMALQKKAARKPGAVSGLVEYKPEVTKELMKDFMSTTNPCTIAEVEGCKDKEQLRNLIVRRQPRYE